MMKTPLLDLGNVVVKVNFLPFLEWLASRSKTDSKVDTLLSSSLFYDFEFGNIGKEEFASRLKNLYGAEFSLPELEEAFCGIFPSLVDGMEDLIQDLAAQGSIYCLSNTNEIHLEYCRNRFPVLSHFTKIFASHEMRKRKPYPGIYRQVVNELGLEASSVVFFDDVMSNVVGAQKAGLQAHLFEGSEQVAGLVKNFKELVDNAVEGSSYEGNQ